MSVHSISMMLYVLTMQTQSTPSKKPSCPFLVSLTIKSSKPSLPLSSIPSKQKRMFTGSGNPRVLCASRTFNHPRTGPLSSEDPRPINRPVDSSMTSLNGSVFHPSDNSAYPRISLLQRFIVAIFTHRLYIKVTINEHSFLLGIIADSP